MPRFIENVAAFAEALGPEKATLVLPLATVSWGSSKHRDTFIQLLTGGVGQGEQPQEEEVS